jgi:hypothetical protein
MHIKCYISSYCLSLWGREWKITVHDHNSNSELNYKDFEAAVYVSYVILNLKFLFWNKYALYFDIQETA